MCPLEVLEAGSPKSRDYTHLGASKEAFTFLASKTPRRFIIAYGSPASKPHSILSPCLPPCLHLTFHFLEKTLILLDCICREPAFKYDPILRNQGGWEFDIISEEAGGV